MSLFEESRFYWEGNSFAKIYRFVGYIRENDLNGGLLSSSLNNVFIM